MPLYNPASGGGSGTLTTIEEVDGNPTDSAVTKLVMPNGTLAIAGHVATYTDAGGGGGTTLSTLGYNTIGSSTEAMTSNRWYCKKVTSSGTGILLSIGAYVITDGANNQGNLNVAVFDDNTGAPGKVIAYNHVITNSELLTEAALGTPVARWVHVPIGCPTTAADFWIAVQRSGGTSTVTITYDGSGSDQYATAGGSWVADLGGSLYALTTSSNKYSIRATFLV